MSDQLQRVYDALQAADAAGDTQAAAQLAQYARDLQAQQPAVEAQEDTPKGLSDKYLHNPLTYGLPAAMVGFAATKPVSAIGAKLTPKSTLRTPPAAGEQPVPPRAGPVAVPESVGPLGQGAVKNIEHNLGQQIGNKLHLGFQDKPVAGFNLRPGSLVITPTSLTTPPAAAAPSAPAAAPRASMPRMRSALQAAPKPAGRGATTFGMGIAAGSGIDAVQQAREGNIAPAAASTLSTAGGAAMTSSNPKIRALGGLASLLGIGSRYLMEPEEEKAVGGAIQGYSKGKAVKAGLSILGRKPAHEAADEVKKLSDVAQGHIGRFYVPTQADRMGGVGGPSYSANQLLYPEYQNMAWGSGQQATATGLANLARDPRFGGPEGQLFAPLLGAENMHQSNQMVFDTLANQFFKNRKNLTPEMRKAINDYMQTGGTISGKKAGFEGYPGFDIANQDMIRELGKTFEARKQIAQHAFGGQGLGGRKAQIIPYEEILRKTRDPLTEGAETFSMGPRAFQLTGEVHPTPRPDLNPAYPFQLYGSDIGAAYTPVPSELALMDFQRGWRQATGKNMPLKSGKLPQPGYYEHTMGYTPAGSSQRVYPRQQITEDWIKELQRSGFKHGGLATLEN